MHAIIGIEHINFITTQVRLIVNGGNLVVK